MDVFEAAHERYVARMKKKGGWHAENAVAFDARWRAKRKSRKSTGRTPTRSATERWRDRIAAAQSEGLSTADATRKAIREEPWLHREMLDEVNGR